MPLLIWIDIVNKFSNSSSDGTDGKNGTGPENNTTGVLEAKIDNLEAKLNGFLEQKDAD